MSAPCGVRAILASEALMRLKNPRFAIPAAAAAMVLVGGCATLPEGFAYLQGERWSKVELNTYDVIIISVDDSHYIEDRYKPVIIEPGMHKIVVQGPPVAGFTYGEQRTLTLDVKPCTHYWLEAKKPGPLSQDFEPRVNYEEPLAGCRPPGKQ
jgi:hypothetical protein